MKNASKFENALLSLEDSYRKEIKKIIVEHLGLKSSHELGDGRVLVVNQFGVILIKKIGSLCSLDTRMFDNYGTESQLLMLNSIIYNR